MADTRRVRRRVPTRETARRRQRNRRLATLPHTAVVRLDDTREYGLEYGLVSASCSLLQFVSVSNRARCSTFQLAAVRCSGSARTFNPLTGPRWFESSTAHPVARRSAEPAWLSQAACAIRVHRATPCRTGAGPESRPRAARRQESRPRSPGAAPAPAGSCHAPSLGHPWVGVPAPRAGFAGGGRGPGEHGASRRTSTS
jgi:hypothetical protein